MLISTASTKRKILSGPPNCSKGGRKIPESRALCPGGRLAQLHPQQAPLSFLQETLGRSVKEPIYITGFDLSNAGRKKIQKNKKK
jgi:hypothetical protein